MSQRSDRVKSVDMHPTEPWVLCALYSGKVAIYNYSTSTIVKTFDVSDLPVRCAKFIPRKQWIIAGADDMLIRVFNYNTQERIAQFEGHQDYIRYIEVHPTQPYILTSSDDMQVRLWDWEKNWQNIQTYEGHAHYVMMVRINPKDTNTFATASLDRSVKVWSLSSPTPNFSLEGHERGVNCLDYYPGGDKPYIVSGADDFTLRIWDYQTRSCVTTLEGHSNNICAVAFHSRLPFVLSGAEDGTVRVWHNTTYRLESTLNYGMERVWSIASGSSSNKVAIGYDEGTVVIKLGKEMPVASMDKTGKLIIARNNVIYASKIRSSSANAAAEDDGEEETSIVSSSVAVEDGVAIPIVEKELGHVELFPQSISHNANSRFVAVVGDNEYVIYTAQALRNKSFGQALDFAWSATGTGDYAVRESTSKIKVFKNFKEVSSFKPAVSAEGLYGGALICVRSADAVLFYEWENPDRLVRRIEVAAKAVHWNDSGELVAITSDDSFFILRFDKEAYLSGLSSAVAGSNAANIIAEEGVEAAFVLQNTVEEKVRNGIWVGDVYLYNNSNSRLNYAVGGEVVTLAHLDRHMYLLGYLHREGRVYLIDKSGSIVSYALLLSLIEYQTAVVRGDFETANSILPQIPRDQYNAVAKFLDGQGFKEEALAVADDPDLKFDLAVQLNKLDMAKSLLLDSSASDADSPDTQAKWKSLLDLALARCDLQLAEQCALAANDTTSMLLLYSSIGNAAGILKTAELAKAEGSANIAFTCYMMTGQTEQAAQLLVDSNRFAEAAVFARTYAPSLLPSILPLWQADLVKRGAKRAAEALANPDSNPDSFPDFNVAIMAENIFKAQRESGARAVPAQAYPTAKADLDLYLIAIVKGMMQAGGVPLSMLGHADIETEEIQEDKVSIMDEAEAETEETKEEEEVVEETAVAETAPVSVPDAAPVDTLKPEEVDDLEDFDVDENDWK
jgi:coatomer subunit beta'